MSLHEIKRNDTKPYWPVDLVFDDGTVAPITGATVKFIARDRSDDTVKIEAPAVITDAGTAAVEYRFVASDTDTAGFYYCEWEVTYADGNVQTFPTRGYDRLKVIGDLA